MFMNLHGLGSDGFSTYLRSHIGKSQWEFDVAANDESTCTIDK